MKKRIIAISLLCAILALPVHAGLSEFDYSILDDMTVEELQTLKISIDTRIADKRREASKGSQAQLEHYEVDMSAGYYIAGKDFPVGKYQILSISGSGNLHCRGTGLNEILGGTYGITEYNNFTPDNGDILSVGGDAVIRLVSDNADVAGVVPRPILDSYNWYEAPAGIYLIGTDIVEGCYRAFAIQGSGNVHANDREHTTGSINEIFSVDSGYSGAIIEFKNLHLYDGTELEISGDLLLRLEQISE